MNSCAKDLMPAGEFTERLHWQRREDERTAREIHWPEYLERRLLCENVYEAATNSS